MKRLGRPAIVVALTGVVIALCTGCSRSAVEVGGACEQAGDCAPGLWCLGKVCQDTPVHEIAGRDSGDAGFGDGDFANAVTDGPAAFDAVADGATGEFDQGKDEGAEPDAEDGWDTGLDVGQDVGPDAGPDAGAGAGEYFSSLYGSANIDLPHSLRAVRQGGYVLAGGTGEEYPNGDAFVVLVAPDGSPVWAHAYGGRGDDAAYDIVQTMDGGFVVAGYTESFSSWNRDAWVFKLDPNGEIEWQKRYQRTTANTARSIVELGDGGFAFVGVLDHDFWIVRLDSNGSVVWQKVLGSVAGTEEGLALAATRDGALLAVGIFNGFDIWIVKFGGDGAIKWSRTYGGGQALGITSTHDDGCVVVGCEFASGHHEARILRLDPAGNFLWQKTFDTGQSGCAIKVAEKSDGGIVVVGHMSPPVAGYECPLPELCHDIWLIGLDSGGSLQWQYQFGGPNDDRAAAAVVEPDGTVAFVGIKEIEDWYENPDGDFGDFWLLKMRGNGGGDQTCPGNLGRPPNFVLSDGNATVVDVAVVGRDTSVAVVDTDAVASEPYYGFHSNTECSSSR